MRIYPRLVTTGRTKDIYPSTYIYLQDLCDVFVIKARYPLATFLHFIKCLSNAVCELRVKYGQVPFPRQLSTRPVSTWGWLGVAWLGLSTSASPALQLCDLWILLLVSPRLGASPDDGTGRDSFGT